MSVRSVSDECMMYCHKVEWYRVRCIICTAFRLYGAWLHRDERLFIFGRVPDSILKIKRFAGMRVLRSSASYRLQEGENKNETCRKVYEEFLCAP